MKGVVDPAHVRAAAGGKRSIRKLFSKEQRAFFGMHAPDGVELDDLIPRADLRAEAEADAGWVRAQADRRAVALPDNSRVLELSTKCTPAEAFDVAAKARAFLTERGIDLGAEQQTKTHGARPPRQVSVSATAEPAVPSARRGLARPARGEACARLDVEPRSGLDAAEVERRRAEVGPNRLAEGEKEPGWRAFLRQYRDLMQLVLLGAAVVSIVALQEWSTGLVIVGSPCSTRSSA